MSDTAKEKHPASLRELMGSLLVAKGLLNMADVGIPDRSKIEPVAWMREVHPINGGQERFYELAHIAGEPGRLLVADHSRGGAWNYCIEHNAVYPINAHCPLCNTKPVAEAPESGAVTASNSPVLER